MIKTQTFNIEASLNEPAGNSIDLVEVLKAELRSICETDVDADYTQWMLKANLEENSELFLLQPDHIIDAEKLFEKLKMPAAESQFEKLRTRLSSDTQERLRADKFSNTGDFLSAVVSDLNLVLKKHPQRVKEQLGATADLEFQITENVPKANWRAINRLLLQAAFPETIEKVWNTLSGVYSWIHAHPRTALCLSGGGIRSATFGLGVLQGLSNRGIVQEMDYLSTVSGGGYIGSWLSAWLSRENRESVFVKLSAYPDKTPLTPEPEQIRHLRTFSNYLTPKLGILSADTWTLIATYVRNLFLNWVIFLPALATALMLPRGCVTLLRVDAPASYMIASAAIGSFLLLSAIVYAAWQRPSLNKGRLAGATSHGVADQSGFLLFCFAPLWLSAVCFTAFWGWLQNPKNQLHAIWFNNLPSKYHLLIPVALVICVHVIGWCFYSLKLKKNRYPELLAVIATGAFGGVLFWLGTKFIRTDLTEAPALEWYVSCALPYFFLAFLLTVTSFIGLVSRVTTDEDREWWARMGGWLLIGALAWSPISALVLLGPEAFMRLPHIIGSLGGISAIITLILSSGDKTPANKDAGAEMDTKGKVLNFLLGLAAPLFIACLVVVISLGTSWVVKECDWTHQNHGAAKFSAEDIIDLPAFTAKLKHHSDPITSYLWGNLSDATRDEILAPSSKQQTPNERIGDMLANDFNKIIRTNLLYTGSPFIGLVSTNTVGVTNGWGYGGQRLMQANRLMFENIYPHEIASARFDHLMITHETLWREFAVIFISFGAISWFLSRFININKFSLNAVYRNRLIRAYLGASNPTRRPNPFSGFDPSDNLCMDQLTSKPFHIINMTLNLVNGQNLAWQQRMAESFTASRLHAGCFRLGYRDVKLYASEGSVRPSPSDNQSAGSSRPSQALTGGAELGGLTLGTSVSISGAAASPNCGYHSSPVVAFLMTLFNVRLGGWLGNPGKAGDNSFMDRAPRSAVWHVVKEAFGLTDDTARYVYLSDGGHNENLGLYEMVLRRCRCIVVSDAGCDPDCTLEDLGNAIRKIRIDLGIPIEIDKFDIASRKTKLPSKYCAIGRIHYDRVDGPGVPPGILIYIKPALSGNEPRDVFNYKESSLLFPHEPTSDQWFSESQFESYRMLGFHIVNIISDGAGSEWEKSGSSNLERFQSQVSAYLDKAAITGSAVSCDGKSDICAGNN